MSLETAMVAEQRRFREWATQIRGCQNRSAGMSVIGWCSCHGITKANYFYRLRRVRQVCLETIQEKMPIQQVVPVQPDFYSVGRERRQAAARTGYPHKGIFHPCNGVHAHAAPVRSP